MAAKIHGLVYIIVGLFVAAASWEINFGKLLLFFYAGLAFILIGIIKLILGKRNEAKAAVHHKPQHQARFRYCPRCANILRPHDRFCSVCGAKA